MKLFYTGPLVNAELLVVMLEKHSIDASQKAIEGPGFEDGDLNQPTEVWVPEKDYQKAYELFYAERQDEL
jgi:hypothetical protein